MERGSTTELKRRLSPRGAGVWVSRGHFSVPRTRSHQPECRKLWLLTLFSWNCWFCGPNLVALGQQPTRRSPTSRILHIQMSSHRISWAFALQRKKRMASKGPMAVLEIQSLRARDEGFSKAIYNLVLSSIPWLVFSSCRLSFQRIRCLAPIWNWCGWGKLVPVSTRTEW